MKYSHNTLRDIASVLCFYPSAQFEAGGKNNLRISNSAVDFTNKSASGLYITSVLHFKRLIIYKANSIISAIFALYNQVVYRLIYAFAEERLNIHNYITASVSNNLPFLIYSCLGMIYFKHYKYDSGNYDVIMLNNNICLKRNLNTQGTFLPYY